MSAARTAAIAALIAAAIGPSTAADAREPVFAPPCAQACRHSNIPRMGVVADPLSVVGPLESADGARSAAMQAGAGAQWARITISWAEIEPTADGGLDARRLADYDAQVRAIDAAGMRILVTISDSPAWARPHSPEASTANPPTDLAAYRAFVNELTRHFAALGVDAYEVWNEPNLHAFWNSPDPAGYVRLLKVAYSAIKAADPDAAVVAGSLAPVRRDGSPEHFLERMYAAGAKGHFDVLSVHVFPFGNPRWCERRGRVPRTLKNVCFVEHYRDVQRRFGDSRPIWITEFGYGTEGLWSVPAVRQARWLKHGFSVARRYSYLRAIFWYSFRDLAPAGVPADTWTMSAGLVRADYSPKPALAAFRQVARRFAQLRAE